MLAAELRWISQHATAPERRHIETTYGAEITNASDGKTIFLLASDKERLSKLARETNCPTYHADRIVPFPPGALLNMPRPLPLGKQPAHRIEGKGWSSHIATSAPLPDRLAEKKTPGPAFDLAAARTFQERPEGRGAPLREHSWVTVAYREDAEQRKAGRDRQEQDREDARKELDRQENTTYPETLRICTQRQLQDLRAFCSTNVPDRRTLPGGSVVSSRDIQDLMAKTPHASSDVVGGFMAVLRDHVSRSGRTEIEVLNVEPGVDLEGWRNRAYQRGVSTATFDHFRVIIIPVVTAQHHHGLIVVDANGKEPQITVFNPDAPGQMLKHAKIASLWLAELTNSDFTTAMAPDPHPQGIDCCAILVCYYAALYVARGEVATLAYIDEASHDAVAHWIGSVLLSGKLDASRMDRLREPSATPPPEPSRHSSN